MRNRWSLSGTWNFAVDPKDIGETEDWYQGQLPTCNEVQVPHLWQRDGGELLNYYGVAWYTRKFKVTDRNCQKQLFLHFDAVDYMARVWINGQFVGEHEGGFTPFEFDITDYLNDQEEQTCTVRVYDPQDNSDIPIGKQGTWYTRVSGIWQDVYMEERADSFIDHIWITPHIDRSLIDVRYRLSGQPVAGGDLAYAVKVYLNNNSSIITGKVETKSADGCFQVEITDPILWEPENPHLYELEVTLASGDVSDTKTELFGMRKVEHAEGMIKLNNKPLYMRGALDQAFYPDTIYSAPSDEYIQREIQLAKEMGFNLLRKHIKIELPRYLYWADRMGMLIWAEPPNYVKWTKTSQRRFRNELRAMIDRDYNRPSIIIWSIYNEEWGLEWDLDRDTEKQRHVAEMYDELKEYDPTRLICDNSGWTHVKTDVNDHHRYFVCPDQLTEWQHDLDDFVIGDPDKNFVGNYRSNGEPIIVSEFGVWGLPSMEALKEHYGDQEPWWFINQGEETHQDDYKRPVTARENFSKFELHKTFENFEILAVASQRRMFRAVKSIIEEMRKRPQIAGYVVTEFTDIEWETNGWLDFLRNPKEGFERLKDFNGSLVIMANNVIHNLWSGESQSWDVVISNNDMKSIDGVIRWHIEGTGITETIPVRLDGELQVTIKNAINFIAPEVSESGFYKLRLELLQGTNQVACNEEELTISPVFNENQANAITPYQLPESLIHQLQTKGFDIQSELQMNAVVLTDCLDEKVLTFASQGGHVVFLAEQGNELPSRGQFTFRLLPEGESWPRASSFNFVDAKWFDNIPLQPEMGWEVDALIPKYVVPFHNYKMGNGRRTISVFGNSSIAESSEIISGYFQGWIGQVGGSIVRKPHGKGSIVVVTWRLMENYAKHPIAGQVLHKIIEKLSV